MCIISTFILADKTKQQTRKTKISTTVAEQLHVAWDDVIKANRALQVDEARAIALSAPTAAAAAAAATTRTRP